MTTTVFLDLGLTQKETDTITKMLPLGAQPASVIAKYIGQPRTSTYVILERLKQHGLVEEFKRQGITYFKCISVRSIPDLIRTRERQLEQVLTEVEEKLPELLAMENKLSITPTVRFLEGKTGAMKMYEEVLKEKEFRAMFNPKIVKQRMPEYYEKVAEMLRAKGGYAKELLVESSEAKAYQKRFQSQKHQIKILPKDTSFPSDTIICSDKIYMIAYGEREISATEIRNLSLSQTQQTIFDMLWASL